MIFANHDLKLIFVHIPKCGGTYVSNILNSYYAFAWITNDDQILQRDDHAAFCGDDPNHYVFGEAAYGIRKQGVLRYLEGHPKYSEIFGVPVSLRHQYRSFAVVRNPYDRMVSAYTYLKDSRNRPMRMLNRDYMHSFSLFLASSASVSNASFCHAFITQYDHLLGNDGKLGVSRVLRLESLDSDLCDLLRESGVVDLTHLSPENAAYLTDPETRNASARGGRRICEYYGQAELDFVNLHFAADFDHFGYTCYATVSDMDAAYGGVRG